MNRFNYIVNKFPKEYVPADSTLSLYIGNPNDLLELDLNTIHQQKNSFANKLTFSIYMDYQPDKAALLMEEVIRQKSKLFQFFFHPQYEIKKMRPVVFFSNRWKEHKGMDHYLQMLESECKLQGFRSLQAIFLKSNNEEVKENEAEWSNIDQLDEFENFYFDLLIKKKYYGNYIMIWPNSNTFNDVSAVKLKAEEKFKSVNPIQYDLAVKFVELNKKIDQLEENLRNANEDLLNQKQYVELIRQYDEANKINQFYYNEYEVLPLWYKRMGHVIKVLTGKRSFRSLYNTNIKKYKS